jgi:hypothetical protein
MTYHDHDHIVPAIRFFTHDNPTSPQKRVESFLYALGPYLFFAWKDENDKLKYSRIAFI